MRTPVINTSTPFDLPTLDFTLLHKYPSRGPRYTSYPTALNFSPRFAAQDLRRAIEMSKNKTLSLYVHIPFCHRLCYYCGCNKIVTRLQSKADIYLDYLLKEIALQAEVLGHKPVTQLHLGGGTPNFLTDAQLQRLVDGLKAHFNFTDDAQLSIEIDPRNMTPQRIDSMAKMGFNRLSIGIQDTNPTVQEAINRVQSSELIERLINRAKQKGFRSINLDLIYGMPFQTPDTFARTLDFVHKMQVERVSLFSYAHLPERFAAQRKLATDTLPNSEQKFHLMRQAVETLCANGYQFIGIDHFALPSDELAKAQQNKVLGRNFQGYTTDSQSDLLGLGVSAISALGNSYSQNHKDLAGYYDSIEHQGSALEKGLTLSKDDLIRQRVISDIMCNSMLDKTTISLAFEIDFDQYFADELQQLTPFVEDGLVTNLPYAVIVAPKAQLLLRSICMVFDAYLGLATGQKYSATI
ncbi:oxygen-independent coproporphyrinogen III oxidase [Paraglaciecola chathamensis]|uniref:Coproporphyrinogen-III oxidase n=1 Tax=Paraglaciecola chathamensis S18K6 TaxID=1127672 RepID=A0AAV3UXZ0_9ALTE|nr:oxygen-independent coproporphyrinogen III oxidase [Paraglaciecola chathamensis]GAC12399.1 oxygen-independent coproporphyrinogen-III oxidase [Paraglaciecola chathamensis S18K6]